ncbi:hypothetical protein [Streptomyces tsukubensis]|uniref:hypothetical protein n=1 Tax=Streptomyces tsukubensis TaxID=83656 RepID=UPI00344CC7E0
MHTPVVRRGAVAASAVSLALLLAACGEEDGSKDVKGERSGGEGMKQSAPAKSRAELDKLILGKKDIKGHSVELVLPALLKDAKATRADKSECAMLNEALTFGAPGSEGAFAARKTLTILKDEPAATGSSTEEKLDAWANQFRKDLDDSFMTQVSLSSYAGGEAEKSMAGLKKSAESCAGGFTSTAPAEKVKYTKITPAPYAGGDEALAYTATADLDGEPMVLEVVVIRKGAEIISTQTICLGDRSRQPKDILDAQLRKLG